MNELKLAYEKWIETQPKFGHACCNSRHTYDKKAMPDAQVCARERAWRVVVRVRDKNYKFPFNIKYDDFVESPERTVLLADSLCPEGANNSSNTSGGFSL